MVLARELGLEQVQEIFKFIQEENICGPSGKRIRLEMFIHGALCMSISGKCYLSLHQYNYSANRGGCLQACRRGYVVTEKETGNEVEIDNDYMMSPKDLCTIPFLNKILDSGVQVLKIEGRARSPEYVKVVTECYNEAINAYLENDYTQDKIDNWLKQLKTVFNRGFWNGYYLGQPLGEWSHVYGSQARERKEYIGKINNYFTNIQVAEMLLEAGELELNEEIYIIGPTTGVLRQKVEEIRVDLKNTNKAAKGDTLSIPCKTFLRRSDKVYKIIKN
jgi:putative protease